MDTRPDHPMPRLGLQICPSLLEGCHASRARNLAPVLRGDHLANRKARSRVRRWATFVELIVAALLGAGCAAAAEAAR
jgi:hypothetical protein